jgi:endonuclease/exonuclease/phosphatase family metal-dependent hydrolase
MTAHETVIISWNLLHTGGASAEQIRHLIGRHRPDLFLMQEATERIDSLPDLVGGHYAREALPGRHHGLAAWSEHPLREPAATLALPRGLIVERICQILQLSEVTVANVHLSHGQVLNRRQLRLIAAGLPRQAAILGDCNMLGSALLRGFHDVGPRQGTHRPARLIPLRLDRCFVRALVCRSAEVLEFGGSDHRPIKVTLAAI